MARTPISVGIIGLGIIGSRVAARLRMARHPVYLWNRTPKPLPNFLGSARAVAEAASVIQLFVRDSEALREVVAAMLPALKPEQVVMNHATVTPEATMEVARTLASVGVPFLDAPFTGSKLMAEKGELNYYIGGDRAVLERVRPVLERSAKTILHVGDAGDATVLKLATNMISATTLQVVSEALALTRAAGVSPEMLVEAMKLNASLSPLIASKLPTMIAREFEPHFSLKNMLKDARYALGIAEQAGLAFPALTGAAQAMSQMEAAGFGEKDYSVLADQFEKAKAKD